MILRYGTKYLNYTGNEPFTLNPVNISLTEMQD